MSKKGFFHLSWISLCASVSIHAYLAYHHYQMKYGLGIKSKLCNINQVFDCDITTLSPYAELFKMPTAVLGLVFNVLLLFGFLAFIRGLTPEKWEKKFPLTLQYMALTLFLASVVMGTLSAVVLQTFCLFCIMAYFSSLLTLVGIWSFFRQSWTPSFFQLKSMGVVLILILSLGFFLHRIFLRPFGGTLILKMAHLQFQDWKNQNKQELTPVEPTLMNPNPKSPMKIIEFADFLCVHCKNAFPKLHNFAKSHPKVELAFQAFPLDATCNPGVKRKHPQGLPCRLAEMAHCVYEQGKGWKGHEWIFRHQKIFFQEGLSTEKQEKLISSLSLDAKRFKNCLESDKTKEIIGKQAQLGLKIGIQGTPSIYINGKKLNGVNFQVLEKIHSLLNQVNN